jgi:hypothetical protein
MSLSSRRFNTVSYACLKEDKNHADCDTPTSWDIDVYSKWCRNGYVAYLTSLIPVPISTAAATSTPATATTAAFVTTDQIPPTQERCRLSRLEIENEKTIDSRHIITSNGSYI